MKKVLHYLILVVVLFTPTSCIKVPSVPDKPLTQYTKVMVDGKEQLFKKEFLDELPDFAPPKRNEPEHADETPTEHLEHELVETFSWLSKISAVLAVLLGALGIVFPALGKIGTGKWFGLVALCSMGIVYATSFMWYIIGGFVWVFIMYLAWKLYKIFKEKMELQELAEHLSIADREESKDIIKAHKLKSPRSKVRVITQE